jgi:hypothetical protein
MKTLRAEYILRMVAIIQSEYSVIASLPKIRTACCLCGCGIYSVLEKAT